MHNTTPAKEQATTIDVVLIRHAQSQWNLENRFTGWADPPLTRAGMEEARRAAQWLDKQGYRFDMAFSSRLTRAQQTLDIILDTLGQPGIAQYQDWRLNERHYGQLQGINKTQQATRVGENQVWRWRRGYEDKAAALPRDDPRHPLQDPLYADIEPSLLPDVESLAQTRSRVVGFWNERVVPHIKDGQHILISSHGNTLRALIMELAGLSVAQVESFEIPTGAPILYTFDKQANPLHWRYLSSP